MLEAIVNIWVRKQHFKNPIETKEKLILVSEGEQQEYKNEKFLLSTGFFKKVEKPAEIPEEKAE